MLIWVFLLWGIASLMACWGFSLSVRWVSDWNARRRERLSPVYSKRAFKLAPALIVVCFSVAMIAGLWANQFASINGDYIGILRSPIGILSLLLCASGVLWIIQSVVGDRARGRVRCPRCWYDMSDVPGMMCPECGHESKSRSQHTRTKRPKLAFLIAGVSIGIGAYGLSANRRVITTDLVAVVPTWVLMAGWDWFPTSWIYDDGSVKPNGSPIAIESCLQNRLDDREWVSKKRTERFAGSLAKPMLKGKEARWDSKRLRLLGSMYFQNNYRMLDDWYPLPPSEIDHEELLRLCALDTIHALLANPPTILDERILDSADDEELNAYQIARRWVTRDLDPKKSLYFSTYMGDPELNAHLQSVLSPIFADIDQPEIVAMINAVDHEQKTLAIRLLMDSKAINLHYMNLVSMLGAPTGSRDFRESLSYFVQTLYTLPEESQSQADERIAQWLRSDHIPERLFALWTVSYLTLSNNRIPEDQQPYDLSVFMGLVQEFSLGDERLIDGPQYPDSTVHSFAVSLLLKHDRTGLVSFPLISEMIDQQSFPLYSSVNAFYYEEDEWTDDSYKAWIDAFGSLADSHDPQYRIWMLKNFPKQTDSIYEEQLIEIAASLIHDDLEDVAMLARQILWNRGIDRP